MTDDIYQDIRPYNDSEVPAVMQRIAADPEFIDAVSHLKFGRWAWLFKPLVKRALYKHIKKIHTVKDLQVIVESYMQRMLDTTTSSFTIGGFDNLQADQAYLFISNHRDIALDPALVNLALHRNGIDTARIAIGDNLLTRNFASDMMRVNKSFLVRRSIKGGKALFVALKKLSAYMASCREEGCSVWIAQREGRAKDGNDRTEPAILKMIDMARPKTTTFAEYVKGLNIVPVAISYEFDPCDLRKARELNSIAQFGKYDKQEGEDIASIAAGITGFKGNVHLEFCPPVTGEFDNADELASYIDQQIIGAYRLFATNAIAFRERRGRDAEEHLQGIIASAEVEQRFNERLDACTDDERSFLLDQYANPVISRIEMQLTQSAEH